MSDYEYEQKREQITEAIRHEMNGLRPIIVERHVLFFCKTEEVPLARMRHYYTNYAIGKFFMDGYLRWKDEK